jgi:hypothetical protein
VTVVCTIPPDQAPSLAAPVLLRPDPHQASTNTLLAHFLSIVFANIIVGIVNKVGAAPQAA